MSTYRDIENKIQAALYNNLHLLKMIYPTSPDFDKVFEPNMFAKNNKAAFHEVVYYLLYTLNPELTKEKIKTWPLFEIKQESNFRSEVLNFVNELNNYYEYAQIPLVISAHLISPGGYKFLIFMLKLSMLVIFEHLKKSDTPGLIYSPRITKDIDLFIETINKKTRSIKMEIQDKINKFQQYEQEQKEKADHIWKELTKLDKNIPILKGEQAVIDEEFRKKYAVDPSYSSLKSKLTILKQKWESLNYINKIFENCNELLDYIKSSNLEISIFEEGGKVNGFSSKIHTLPEFFDRFAALINSKSLKFLMLDNSYIEECLEKVSHLNNETTLVLKEFESNKEKINLWLQEIDNYSIFIDTISCEQPRYSFLDDLAKLSFI